MSDGRRKHGHSWPVQSKTYMTWKAMHNRCRHKPRYKGRVTVCERWASFENFLADMGEAPAGLSLDRIDNEKGYSPGNCRWATPREQQNNTRRNSFLTFNGRTQTLTQWSREIGLTQSGLYYRLKRGLSIEQALTLKRDESKVKR